MLFRDDLKITFKVGYRRYDICVELIEDDYNIMRDIEQCIERNNIYDFSEVHVSFRGVVFRLVCATLEHFKTAFGCLINNCYGYYLDGDNPYNYYLTNYRERYKYVTELQTVHKSLPICINVSRAKITLIDSFANPIEIEDFNDNVVKRTIESLNEYNPKSNGIWRFYVIDEGVEKVFDVEFYSTEGFYRAVYDVMIYLCNCSKIKQSKYSSIKHVFYNTNEIEVLNYFLNDSNDCSDSFSLQSAINKMNN